MTCVKSNAVPHYDVELDTLCFLLCSSYAPVQSMAYITTELWMEHLVKVSLVW